MKKIKIIVTNQLHIQDNDAIQSIDRLQAALMMKYWDQFYQSKYGELSGAIVQEGNVFYIFNETQSQLVKQIEQIANNVSNIAFVKFEIDLINENDCTYLKKELESILTKSYFNLKIA